MTQMILYCNEKRGFTVQRHASAALHQDPGNNVGCQFGAGRCAAGPDSRGFTRGRELERAAREGFKGKRYRNMEKQPIADRIASIGHRWGVAP